MLNGEKSTMIMFCLKVWTDMEVQYNNFRFGSERLLSYRHVAHQRPVQFQIDQLKQLSGEMNLLKKNIS